MQPSEAITSTIKASIVMLTLSDGDNKFPWLNGGKNGANSMPPSGIFSVLDLLVHETVPNPHFLLLLYPGGVGFWIPGRNFKVLKPPCRSSQL